jgi:hypothetical protein
VTLFVCKWLNQHAIVLRINVWPVGDCLFGALSKSAPGARVPLAPPKGRPWSQWKAWYIFIMMMMMMIGCLIQFSVDYLRAESTARGPVIETAQTTCSIHKQHLKGARHSITKLKIYTQVYNIRLCIRWILQKQIKYKINPLTPELKPSAQRCLTRFFYWGFCFLNRAFR